MDERKEAFGLVITSSAKTAYYKLLHYLYRHYSPDRAQELAEAILDEPLMLLEHPDMGSPEMKLADRAYSYGYLLFRRSNSATVKIIYFVDKVQKTIYVTDFFPTEMHPDGMFDMS